MDPNTQHQLWSRWRFGIREAGRQVPRADVELNAARWICKGFGSAGRVRVLRTVRGWLIEALIEGVPAHDPGYVASVRQQFRQRFVEPGWGMFAHGRVSAYVMAGDVQDGKSRAQMVMMPVLDLKTLVGA